MKMFRIVVAVASVAAGAFASQSASATISGDMAFNQRLLVPIFVPDVRKVIVNAAKSHQWQIIEDRPGELTLELQHAKAHMDVVAKVYYSTSELSLRKISVKTFQCESQSPCEIDSQVVTRWMIGLRREIGVEFLRLAIQDSGGELAGQPAPAAEEQ